MAAKVSELTYYPVKGCAGIGLTEARITPDGIAHDRDYVIVDEKGELRWQWGDPKLALITPEPAPNGGPLTLRAPGCGELRLDGSGESEKEVELPGRSYGTVDQGETAAEWLSQVLGSPSRLLRVRPRNGGATANHSRLHVVSRASLDLLNGRLVERGAPPLPMNRFRPNMVVDGWDTPHTEDRAARLLIAGTELTFTEPTVRCAITMVDQETGHRDGPEPLRTLADYRRASDGVVFGAYFAVARAGKVSVGDAVGIVGKSPDRPSEA
ncbi:MOSC N-terminal beta barrel domain-containing protein [Streptomyces sp. NPDC013178]|uniref:MOSC domain-containing protein n=1 Tax=unclassified Streptomyces TaxID=2593676 RepID=UPI0033C3EC43